MCVIIQNSMHGLLLLGSLKKQRELIQGPITSIYCNYNQQIKKRSQIITTDEKFQSYLNRCESVFRFSNGVVNYSFSWTCAYSYNLTFSQRNEKHLIVVDKN